MNVITEASSLHSSFIETDIYVSTKMVDFNVSGCDSFDEEH